jgi:chaperonin GroES
MEFTMHLIAPNVPHHDAPQWVCVNCAIAFGWQPVRRHDETFCCEGCAAGGPCTCDYAALPWPEILEEAENSHMPKKTGGDTSVAKIRPVADRVVVKPLPKEEMSKGGIIIPDTAKEKPQEGTVVAVGAGKLLDNGDRAAMELKVGDRVLFAKYGGTEFKFEGEDLLVLRESDVLAVLAD